MIERDDQIRIELTVRTLRRMARQHPGTPLLVKGSKLLCGKEVIDTLHGRNDDEIITNFSREEVSDGN